MQVYCPRCPTGQTILEDASSRGAFSCDFCSTKHKKGEFRVRCKQHDFDACQKCAQNISNYNNQFTQMKHQCKTCRSPLQNATYTEKTSWRCDGCSKSFNKYTELRLRCYQHDYDLCGQCNQGMQNQFNMPPQQNQGGFNMPPQQNQGGFNMPPQNQNQGGFNNPPIPFNEPKKTTTSSIACYQCQTTQLEDASSRKTGWRCDFCSSSFKAGQERWRCNKHDFDVCGGCVSKFSGFNNTFETMKHACKTCRYPLMNATYTEKTNWRCDQCHKNFNKFTELRLRCSAHDYDLCGQCVNGMQNQFNQPGFVQPPQQNSGFNQPPQQQNSGFNQPPQSYQFMYDGVMGQEQVLQAGQYMSSPNKKYHLLMQHDGELGLYENTQFVLQQRVWGSGSANKGQNPCYMKLQQDGNLVVYDRNNKVTWSTNTYGKGKPQFRMFMQDDRNISIYDGQNQMIYQTMTNQQQQQGFNQPPQQQPNQGFNNPQQNQQQIQKLDAELKNNQAKIDGYERQKKAQVERKDRLVKSHGEENVRLQKRKTEMQENHSKRMKDLLERQEQERQRMIQRFDQEKQSMEKTQHQEKDTFQKNETRTIEDHNKQMSQVDQEIAKYDSQIMELQNQQQQINIQKSQLSGGSFNPPPQRF